MGTRRKDSQGLSSVNTDYTYCSDMNPSVIGTEYDGDQSQRSSVSLDGATDSEGHQVSNQSQYSSVS